LKTDDEKRKALSLADNRLSDLSEFDTGQLDAMLSKLSDEIKDMAGFGDLDLKEGVEKPKKINTKPFRKTHILLSFPPEMMLEIQDRLSDILMMEGVECEQSSN